MSTSFGIALLFSPGKGEGYPSPVLAKGVPLSWGTPIWDWGIPQKNPGTRDLGKNLGVGYIPQRTWDQRMGMDLGPEGRVHPSVLTETHL